MSVTLLAFGILIAVAGLAAAGFGISINELPLGHTLIVTGAIGLAAGLQLIGLSAAVADLAAIRKSLLARLAPRQARSAEPAAATPLLPEPKAIERAPSDSPTVTPAPVEVSASVIERMRSNIPRPERTVPVADNVPLSPNGSQSAAHVEPVSPTPARSNGAASETTVREPRLDFLFRPKPARPAPTETFDNMWPKRSGRADPATAPAYQEAPVSAEPVRASDPSGPIVAQEPADALPSESAPPPAPEFGRSVAILKSGVVDGMAYTLYADGSIEAQLPQGTVRFGSIAELRAHIENNA
jgi:hypothetical protein